MKFNRIFAVVAMAAALVATSCEKYDDTELVGRVDNLDNKVEVLEGKVTNLEGALSSLKNAVENKYAVDSVEKTENGWIISFTNGKKIELVNGKDGKDGLNGKDGVDGKDGLDGKDGVDGKDGKDGKDGVDGKDGKDGDSFIKSLEEDAEFVIITLNDEKNTVFMLPKAIKVVIGDAESTYILIDDENNEVELEVPAIKNIAAVSGTVYSSTGSTTDVVITKANESGWTVKISQDYSVATIIADGAPKGSRALFVVTVTKVDGTTYTSSKPIIYFMTDDSAFEQFSAEFESLQQNWSMIYNYIINNDDYADEKYETLKEEALVALNAVSQNIQIKMTWADESYNNGTLATDLDEILASFEEINIQLTQVKNTFDDGVSAIADNEAYELFAQEVEQLERNLTMMQNSTLGNEEYEAYITEELEDEALFRLSSIQQMIEVKKTWAEESYQAGTLADDIDEILASFEEINIMLTQYENWFKDQVGTAAEEAAYELFAQEIEQLERNLTMMQNSTLGNEEYEAYITEELEDEALFRLSSIQQMIEVKKTWAEESYQAGTLAADIDEILASFEEINIQLTQYGNWFKDQMAEAANNAAMEEITGALEELNKQLTQVMNSTVRDEELCAWLDEETIGDVTALFSAVSQHIMTLQTWAEESWSAGTLAEDINEIYSEFDMVGREMTQAMNVFNDAVLVAKNNSAFEAFYGEYEMYQMQLTSLERLAREDENDEALSAISAVSQQLAELMTWATESYEAGTLYEDYTEIVSNFPGIQTLINQVRNTYFAD